MERATLPASPIARAVVLALGSALLFGATAPLVQRASAQAGALASGCLLYAGAALASLLGIFFRRAVRRATGLEAPLRGSWTRLVALALLGGLLAPVLLVLGLKRVDAASGALLLALEAPATLLFARLLYREHLGRRALGALALIFAGGLILAGRPGRGATLAGAALVFGAAAAWALDNVLSRPLADRDPLAVVAGKGLLGAAVGAAAALALSDRWPAARDALALLSVGALGYGVSLQLYLRAQRAMGAARTASVFAAAPFLGAGTALLLGAPSPGFSFLAAAALIGAGLWLHASERHGHLHLHPPLEHEHAHRHDDGHHHHLHEPMPSGAHSHWHQHGPLAHAHEHGEDLHHRHGHQDPPP